MIIMTIVKMWVVPPTSAELKMLPASPLDVLLFSREQS